MKSLQANVNIRFDERDRFKIKKKNHRKWCRRAQPAVFQAISFDFIYTQVLKRVETF